MNINIETNATQVLTTELVDILARDLCGVRLTLSDSGIPVCNFTTTGINAVVDNTYEDAVDALRLKGINLTYTTTYIRFLDPEVLRVLLANNIGDGVGVTINDTNVDLGTLFVNNTQITAFYEAKYFKSMSLYGCTNLYGIDISASDGITRLTVLPAFNGCPNLVKFNGPDSEDCVIDLGRNITTISNVSGSSYRWSDCQNIEKMIVRQPISFPTNSLFLHRIKKMDIVPYEDSEYYGDPEAIWWEILKSSGTNGQYFGSVRSGINPHLYFDGVLVTSLTVPQDLYVIRSNAFSNAKDLVSIALHTDITEIQYAAFNNCINLIIDDLNLPSLSTLGGSAFKGCEKLTSITSLGSITSIGGSAFENCTNLATISFPNTITSVGTSAFGGCTGLQRVDITDLDAWMNIAFGDENANPLKNAHNLYLNNTLVTSVDFTGKTVVKPYVFRAATCLTSVTLPNTITAIGTYAFAGCTNLALTSLPTSITSIGERAFTNCTAVNISDLALPNLASIAVYAFCGDSGKTCTITTVSNLGSITSIPEGCFQYVTSLTSIIIPNTVTSIGKNAFRYCSGLTSITIPNSVTSIDNDAFNDCSGLTSLTIGNSVTSIGNLAFQNCSSLTSISIPNSVTSIGGRAFYGCSGLTSITIPNGVTVINISTFHGCSSLTSVTIPASVTKIMNLAFDSCSGLTSITINATTPPVLASPNALRVTNDCPIYVPAGSVSAYQSAQNWSTYASRIQAIPTT